LTTTEPEQAGPPNTKLGRLHGRRLHSHAFNRLDS
jgi:hypothetical protein